MFLKILKTTSPLTIVFFIVFAFLFCCLPIFNNSMSVIYSHYYFSASAVFVLGLLLPLLQSVGLNNLIYEKDVIKKNSLVLAPVFLLLGAPFVSQADGWIISFLLLFYLNALFSSYQKDRPFSESFNANFLLGTIALFYRDILLLFPLILVAFLTFRNMSWRSVFIALMGLALPILLYLVYTFFLSLPFAFSIPTYKFILPTIPIINTLTYVEIIWFSIVIIILVLSFLELFFWMYKKSIRSRKSFFIILAYFILLLFINIDGSYFLALTPISIVVANFFVYSKRKRLTEILFLLFLLASVYYRISI